MSLQEPSTPVESLPAPSTGIEGVRVSGKQWKAKAVPNKNPALRTSFSKRIQKNRQVEATKALERQLNEERKQAETEKKEASRARKVAREEKERVQLMKAKMHAKLVERRKKREKKNRPK